MFFYLKYYKIENSNLDIKIFSFITIFFVGYTVFSSSPFAGCIELAIVGAATLYQVKLNPKQSHILGSADALMLAEADTSPSFGTMADITDIIVNPGGNNVSVEVFIASS